MLETLTRNTEQTTVLRLNAVTDNHVHRLLVRGINPESFPEITQRLRMVKYVYDPAQLIDRVFEPSTSPRHSTPFKPTRFSSGDKAVFYSALEDETSIAEVKYYQKKNVEFEDLENFTSAPPRYFCLYEIDFRGVVLDLFGIHQDCPELTSKNESGYPKCRELAEEARSGSINAFRTPSARREGGTCAPVFDRQSLGNVPRLKRHGKFTNEHGSIEFREI